MSAQKPHEREQRRLQRQAQARAQLRDEQNRRRKRDNMLGVAAGVVSVALATLMGVTAFAGNPSPEEYRAAQDALSAPTPSATPSNTANIPKPSVAEGKTFTGALKLNGKDVGVSLDGSKAPQAVSVFKTLADQNFFDKKACHRVTTAGIFVLQCGSSDGKGGVDPSFQWGPVENVPADGKYPAGSIAVARANSTDSNGTQFFIVYQDSVLGTETGGYTIMGKVTSGLEVVKGIAGSGVKPGGSSATDGAPVAPALVESFNLK